MKPLTPRQSRRRVVGGLVWLAIMGALTAAAIYGMRHWPHG